MSGARLPLLPFHRVDDHDIHAHTFTGPGVAMHARGLRDAAHGPDGAGPAPTKPLDVFQQDQAMCMQ